MDAGCCFGGLVVSPQKPEVGDEECEVSVKIQVHMFPPGAHGDWVACEVFRFRF